MTDDPKKLEEEAVRPPAAELLLLPRPTFRGVPFPSHEVTLPHAPELAPPRRQR